MATSSLDDLIPATSPLLLPSRHHHHQQQQRRRQGSVDSLSVRHLRNDDIPDDLEFMAPGTWSEHDDDARTDSGGSDDNDNDDPDDDDDDLDDFTLEDGHVAGVPCCNVVLKAK